MTPEGSIIEQSYTLGFLATNNEAKYEVIIAGLKMAILLKVQTLEVRCDSMLVVNQVNGDYAAKNERMEQYMKVVLGLKEKIPRCCFQQVSRADNNHADSLANLGSSMEFQFKREIPVEHIPHPSINRPGPEAMRLDTSPGWREPIIQYLKNKILPGDKAEALKL